MTVTVRRAQSTDAVELARLRWEFRPEGHGAQSREDFTRDFAAWLPDALETDWMAAVAEKAGQCLVGCIFLRTVTKVPSPGEVHRAWGYVTNSYVMPDHRGHGLGAELLDLVITAARERSHELLIVWPSEEAVAFYTRAGFREVADAHAGPDDFPPLELLLR